MEINQIKTIQFRREKIPKKFEQQVIKLGTNKTISIMSEPKITRIINKRLEEGKVKRAFFLTNEQKKKGVEFCKKMLDKRVQGSQIFFF